MAENANEALIKQEIKTDATTPANKAIPQPPPSTTPSAEELQARYIKEMARNEAQLLQAKHEREILQRELEEAKRQRELWRRDPHKALEETLGDGTSQFLDEYTRRLANDGHPTLNSEVSRLKETVTELMAKLNEREKREQQEYEESKEDRYFADFAREVSAILSGEQYPEIKDVFEVEKELFGNEPNLKDLIKPYYKKHYKETGLGLTPAEAADILRNNVRPLHSKLRESSAIKRLLGITVKPEEPPVGSKASPTVTHIAKALTNSMEGSKREWPDLASMSKKEYEAFLATLK